MFYYRSLFIAVFKHLTFVGARACYRTAMEFCKLLLSLDPENDPLGVILAIDFYALRAQKYDWLIRVALEWEASRNLSQVITSYHEIHNVFNSSSPRQ